MGAEFDISTSGPAEQIKLARSELKRLSLPNVVADPDLGWRPTVGGVHVQNDPCQMSNSATPGVTTTTLGNVAGMNNIRIPQVQPGEGMLLREPGGSGDFCLNRGEGLLTLERQRELRDQANSGHYANPSDYMQDAVLMPKTTEVKYFHQQNMPRGWAAKAASDPSFPAWCNRCKIVYLKIPSHYHNNRISANMHTDVLLYSENPADHNGFTRIMKHLFASWCSCKMGKRTNTLCAHRSAAIIALQAFCFFTPKLTKVFRQIDIW